ncbi:flagella biosynthesis chaperone for FliD, FliT [Shewanella sp. A25]|nr:flagella biosynthesis chaperone for FliD, FliT [Shewanella shenzhenensis]
MAQLAEVNKHILLSLEKLNNEKASDEIFLTLVLELQGFVEQREAYIKSLVADNEFTDRQYLVDQLNLSQVFTEQANKVMEDCRALVQGENNAKRYIKAYKAIESNR